MRFPVPLRTLFCLAFAFATAGAWDLHILGPSHDSGGNCGVCAVVSSPELNADCGSVLLSRPENFVVTAAALPGPQAGSLVPAAFYGRAPPSL